MRLMMHNRARQRVVAHHIRNFPLIFHYETVNDAGLW